MTQYRARGTEIVDESGKQIAVVVASNCSKKFAGTLAEAAAKEASRLAAEKTRPAMGAAACAERDMGGTECPAGNCCRPGMCNRGY